MKLRICGMDGLGARLHKGAISMDVEWQIFSVAQGAVVARITTHGGYEIGRFSATENAGHLIGGAFADNVRRLTAEPEFRTLVTSQAAGPTATFAALPFRTTSKPASMDVAAKNVVSVFAGNGHGSGVLISPDGYILTNHHVAGESGRVRIRWSDGAETTGEVVRGDPRRDVALIKTVARAGALSPRETPVRLGEAVLAIGTPLDKELAGTLTQGIVSANRDFEGQPWIQSDVAVTQGNSGGPLLDEKGYVVGLTAWGLRPNGASANLNFFIPIQDALRALALKPAS